MKYGKSLLKHNKNSRNFTRLLRFNQDLNRGIGDDFIANSGTSCWVNLRYWLLIIQNQVNSTKSIESNQWVQTSYKFNKLNKRNHV